MPLGILWSYPALKSNKGRVCQQYKQRVRMSRERGKDLGRGVKTYTVKMWKQHRSSQNWKGSHSKSYWTHKQVSTQCHGFKKKHFLIDLTKVLPQ